MTAPAPKASAKELADELGIDAKALRVYLRANAVPKDDETGRYAFNKTQMKKHLKDYPEWAAHRAEARAAAKAAKEAATTTPDDDATDLADAAETMSDDVVADDE